VHRVNNFIVRLKSGRRLEINQEENGMYVATIREFCPYQKKWIVAHGSVAKTMSEIWRWVRWQKEKLVRGRIY